MVTDINRLARQRAEQQRREQKHAAANAQALDEQWRWDQQTDIQNGIERVLRLLR